MTEQHTNTPISKEPPQVRYLDPEQVRIFHCEKGHLRVEVMDDRCVLKPQFYRVCPLSDPDRYIAIREPSPYGKEIGLLRNWQRLDRESREILKAQLDRRYAYPILQRIYSLQDVHGTYIGIFATDRGVREVTLRDIRDNIVYMVPNRVLITDAEGNRYDIPDVTDLDRVTRGFLARIL